jgi:hypothetical protein
VVAVQDELGTCYDFSSDESVYLLEHGLYGFCTLIVLEPLPLHQACTYIHITGIIPSAAGKYVHIVC